MAANLFCDERNCGLTARVFGFVGGMKQKACEGHAQTLIGKQVTTYSITAFSFIQSLEDASLYEQRTVQMQKGLNALNALETACENSWEEEQKHLQERCAVLHEIVQQSYQEMWLKSQQCYEKMKRDLADMRSQFEKLLEDPNFQLTSEMTDLCMGETVPNRLYCAIIEDCRLSTAKVIMSNFHVLAWDLKRENKWSWSLELLQFVDDQVAANRFDMAVRAAECAKQLGADVPDFTTEAAQQSEETTQQLQCLFSITTINEVEKCLKVGQASYQSGDFDTGLIELQRGRNLLRGSDNWDLYLSLSCAIVEIYYQNGQYNDNIEICEHILSRWTSNVHNLAFLHALFFLLCSFRTIEQPMKAFSAKMMWADKLIADCPRCQCIQLCIEAISLTDEEVKLIEQYVAMALQLDSSLSLITAISRYYLAGVYMRIGRLKESEQAHLSLSELYTAHFPYSLQCASCFLTFGAIYGLMERKQEAKEQLIKANQLYSTRFPHFIEYSACLLGIGKLYEDAGRPLEAMEQFRKAIELCSTHFPNSIIYANSLEGLGSSYKVMNRLQEAEEQYLKADQLYSAYFPTTSEYALCLVDLGELYNWSGRQREAVARVEEARQIFAIVGTQSERDNCDLLLQDIRRS